MRHVSRRVALGVPVFAYGETGMTGLGILESWTQVSHGTLNPCPGARRDAAIRRPRR